MELFNRESVCHKVELVLASAVVIGLCLDPRVLEKWMH